MYVRPGVNPSEGPTKLVRVGGAVGWATKNTWLMVVPRAQKLAVKDAKADKVKNRSGHQMIRRERE